MNTIEILKGKIRELQKKAQFDEKNAPKWVRTLSYIYIPDKEQNQKPTMNETLEQVFSSEFCKIFENPLLIEHL